jgi:competence protein ComEC
VVFFEVGQGDASLVQGREAVLLIDTGSGPPDGSGGTALVRGLRAMGVDSIDVLAVTHADLDHRAGADRVMAAFAVDELWLPISGTHDAPLLALSKAASERGTRVRWLAAGAAGTDRGDLEIEVLWPPPASSSGALSRNESSLVLRVVVDETVFLFTADIGAAVEKELTALPKQLTAAVLKVAHHGSRRSSSAAFLEAVSATVVVVSAPCDPVRGLPSSQALERLRQSGASLWWTGRDGAVIASRDAAGRTSVRSWGRARHCRRH